MLCSDVTDGARRLPWIPAPSSPDRALPWGDMMPLARDPAERLVSTLADRLNRTARSSCIAMYRAAAGERAAKRRAAASSWVGDATHMVAPIHLWGLLPVLMLEVAPRSRAGGRVTGRGLATSADSCECIVLSLYFGPCPRSFGGLVSPTARYSPLADTNES